MKCVIPDINVRVFGKAIHSLAKISEEVSLEPTLEGLLLKSMNSTRSCLALYHFKPRFFQHFDDGSPRPVDDSNEPRYRLPAKSLLAVFRSLSNLERSVEKCTIKLNDDKSRVVFTLQCKHGIIKTYNLTYMEADPLRCALSKSSAQNVIRAECRVYKEVFTSFPSNLEEITIAATKDNILFRNTIDQEAVKDPLRSLSTSTTLDKEEFELYTIQKDTTLAFCVREVKAILMFAEYTCQNIAMYFSESDKPMFVAVEGDSNYDATFITSTISTDSDTDASQTTSVPQMTSASAPPPVKTTKQPTVPSAITKPSSSATTTTSIPTRTTVRPDRVDVSTSEVKVKPHITALMDDSSITLLPTDASRVKKRKTDVDSLLEEIDKSIKQDTTLNKSNARSIFFNTPKTSIKEKQDKQEDDEVLACDSEEDW